MSEQGKGGTLDGFFGVSASGSSIRTEAIAGLTTFLTMAYIVFVNPQILSAAGMPQGAVFVATCIAAFVGTMIMALMVLRHSLTEPAAELPSYARLSA